MLAAAPGRKVAVIGDMLELGDWTETEHRRLSRSLEDAGVSVLVAVGRYACLLVEELAASEVEVVAVDTAEAAVDEIMSRRSPGDTILVKGSRAVGLDRVVVALKEGLGGD
jgi:UDP-N-acetylmuramoyl-tripeptide--D-alanyl-D-alanine ligase